MFLETSKKLLLIIHFLFALAYGPILWQIMHGTHRSSGTYFNNSEFPTTHDPSDNLGTPCYREVKWGRLCSRELISWHGLTMHPVNAIDMYWLLSVRDPTSPRSLFCPSVLLYALGGWPWPLWAAFTQAPWTAGFLFKSSRCQSMAGEWRVVEERVLGYFFPFLFLFGPWFLASFHDYNFNKFLSFHPPALTVLQ